MSRVHGRFGRMYVGIADDSASAEPAVYLRSWSIDSATDKSEVTAQGDGNKVYVSGLPDAKGQYEGFYDTDTAQLWTASQDGLPRKAYLYPDTSDTGEYFFGTAFFDFSLRSQVDGPTQISGSFNAASTWAKVPATS